MSTASSEVSVAFDVERIREDFPVLEQKIHGKPLVYLDNAATGAKAAGGDRRASCISTKSIAPTSIAACTS